jgi:hypothetical protein
MTHIIVIINGLVHSITSYDLTNEYKTKQAIKNEIEFDFMASIREHCTEETFTDEDLHEYFLDDIFNKTTCNVIGMQYELTIQIVDSSFGSISFP